MQYDTPRLCLKVLQEKAAKQVLEFYEENRELFEKYEMDRAQNFYTADYQGALLRCEYNLMLKKQALRFWLFEQERPEQIVGTFSFHNIRYGFCQSCELGYKFAPEYWGRGYARESIGRGIQVIFEEWKLHRIEALVQPENAASVKLLEFLGFQSEGIRRQNVKLHGRWEDHEVYSLLNV